MTQRNVERVIGMLLTDEALRDRFLENPAGLIEQVTREGWDLTETERAALAELDPGSLAAFARRLDPRIRKASLNGAPSGATAHPRLPAPPRTGDTGKAGTS
jgi:hypothetical protein